MAFWPATEDRLINSGYVLDERVANCRSCNAPVRWCTTPNKKKMPLTIATDVNGQETYTSHFSDCPNADAHRRTR